MPNFIGKFTNVATLEAVQALRPIADELGISMAQLALAWVLRRRDVAAAIVGASRPEQLRDAVGASGVQLDEAICSRIDAALNGVVQSDPALAVFAEPGLGASAGQSGARLEG